MNEFPSSSWTQFGRTIILPGDFLPHFLTPDRHWVPNACECNRLNVTVWISLYLLFHPQCISIGGMLAPVVCTH